MLTNIFRIFTISWEMFWWFWDCSSQLMWVGVGVNPWGKSSGFTTKNCKGTPPTTGGAPTLPCSRVSGLLVEARQSLKAIESCQCFSFIYCSSIFSMQSHLWIMQRPGVTRTHFIASMFRYLIVLHRPLNGFQGPQKGPPGPTSTVPSAEVSPTFCYHSAYWKVLRYLQFRPQESHSERRTWKKNEEDGMNLLVPVYPVLMPGRKWCHMM